MSRFDATLCTTAIVMVALVLGFAIVRPPASRPDSQAAPSSASPLRPSSERLLAGLAGTPDVPVEAGRIASAVSVPPSPATGVPSPTPTRTTVPRRPASSRSDPLAAAGPAEAVRVTAATSSRSIGLASWFCKAGVSACTRGYPASGLYAAAGASLRVGKWRGRYISVCLASRPSQCVRTRLIDACQCGRRIVDLYSSVFSRLAPLSRGVVSVKVTW